MQRFMKSGEDRKPGGSDLSDLWHGCPAFCRQAGSKASIQLFPYGTADYVHAWSPRSVLDW
jgi:hypothetical protein